jgi:hypothetical protein
MADNIIDINDRLPNPDPDLVESLRMLLSEAQNGRLLNFAVVYITDDDQIATTYHFDSALEALGAVAYLGRDLQDLLTQ